jgi:hypothetical protein
MEEVESDINLLVDPETAAKLVEQLKQEATPDECHILPKNWETFFILAKDIESLVIRCYGWNLRTGLGDCVCKGEPLSHVSH